MSENHRDQRGGHKSRAYCCDYCTKGRTYERSTSRTKREQRAGRTEQAAENDRTTNR